MEQNNTPTIKSKRGRKSKKELMESLNISPISKLLTLTSTDKPIQLNVNECVSCLSNSEVITSEPIYNEILSVDENVLPFTPLNDIKLSAVSSLPIKKRGRKPKGGKIIQPLVSLSLIHI